MGRLLAFVYGVVSYAAFFVMFLYLIAFLANTDLGTGLVPRTIDNGLSAETGTAILVNLVLLLLFAVPHTVMARPGFKKGWTKVVPEHLERSTYVLVSALTFALIFWQWRAMPEPVWSVANETLRTVLWAVYLVGWLTILYSSFVIDHFDLFGLRQVWLHLNGKPYTPVRFSMRFPYTRLRHPLLLGWLITFWATPDMSSGHILFAGIWSAYIFVAIRYEEADLLEEHGEDYARYRQSVSMFVPIRKGD